MELTIEQLLRQGIAAHREGKLQDAERSYRAILQSQPLHPDANHNLGLLAVAVNKTADALPLFKIALDSNSKIEQFWISYIDALMKENKLELAKQVINEARKLELPRERLDLLEEQLKFHRQKNKSKLTPKNKGLTFTEKRKKLAEAKKRKKKKRFGNGLNPPEAELNDLLILHQSRRYDDAKSLAVSLTERFPKHPFPWKVLGSLFGQSGRHVEALPANEKAVELSPRDPEAFNNLGNTLTELGNLEEAAAIFRQAINLKPEYIEAHSNLGVTLKELGRLEEAEASYRQATALKPDYAEAHANLGVILKELNRLDEAEASYREAIALKPAYAEAHNNLGNTLQEIGRLDEAEASYNQAIALKPDYAQALQNRGLLLLEKKNYESALKDFEQSKTEASNGQALAALYALGRINDIYKRIDSRIKTDEKNLWVAAFSAFFSQVQEKDTAHNFCNKPLDFLYFSNISSHFNEPNVFVKKLIEELENIENIWEPVGKTTRKGFQSKAHVNLFDTKTTQIERLESLIINELDLYYSKFKSKSCAYIKDWPTENNIHGWYVILKEQGYQDLHIHPGGWLSGVIYLKVVPSRGEHEGAIEFGLSSKHYDHPLSSKMIYEPNFGDIVFFPSSLYHRTIPFTTDTNRIIVSFDLLPKQ